MILNFKSTRKGITLWYPMDRIIIISGSNLMTKRGTNLLEVYSVKDLIEDRLTGKSDT